LGEDHNVVKPAGNADTVAPVAPVVEKTIGVIDVDTHGVWLFVLGAELNDMVADGFTVIIPIDVIAPQPPEVVTEYAKVPETVGVPLIVALGEVQLVVKPAGKPAIVTPVAPVVEYVILSMAEFTQTVWLFVLAAELSVSVLAAVTVIEPVAVSTPQPPAVVTV